MLVSSIDNDDDDNIYVISNLSGTYSISFTWHPSQGLDEFLLLMKAHYHPPRSSYSHDTIHDSIRDTIRDPTRDSVSNHHDPYDSTDLSDEQYGFQLLDRDGCAIVLSIGIPPGHYYYMRIDNRDVLERIINDYGYAREELAPNRSDKDKKYISSDVSLDEFQTRYLRIAFADSMIMNERTWLAWTRTSLNIMTCCFSFLFIDTWNEEPFYKKLWCNICVVGFALSFAGCFVVGYLRYRNLVHVLRSRSVTSSYADLDVDMFHIHKIWAWFLGTVLITSCFVFLFALKSNEDQSISVD